MMSHEHAKKRNTQYQYLAPTTLPCAHNLQS